MRRHGTPDFEEDAWHRAAGPATAWALFLGLASLGGLLARIEVPGSAAPRPVLVSSQGTSASSAGSGPGPAARPSGVMSGLSPAPRLHE